MHVRSFSYNPESPSISAAFGIGRRRASQIPVGNLI
jgi:hypothetical protein